MAAEQKPAKKRVVKKVVKRPAAQTPAPTVRYGRPTRTPGPAPTNRQPVAKAAPRKTVSVPRPSRGPGRKAGEAGKAVGQAAAAVVGGIRGSASAVVSGTGSAFGKARAYRLPVMDQTLASAIVGVLVGAITVGVAILFSMAFSELRGTSTGGGRWGSLTVVIVAFLAFAIGELLLATLHVSQPRVTSFLAVCLTLAAIMAFFLGQVSSIWAWLVVPLLGAATYTLSHRAVTAADSSLNQPE